jgi:hypothetical protein
LREASHGFFEVAGEQIPRGAKPKRVLSRSKEASSWRTP